MSYPNSPIPSEEEAVDSEDAGSKGVCSWCLEDKYIVPKAKYCHECWKKCYRVCSRCKLPYPEAKYFEESDDGSRCNSCHKKYVLEKKKQEQRKKTPHTKIGKTTVNKRTCEEGEDKDVLLKMMKTHKGKVSVTFHL